MNILIIQENGRHEKNKKFRECFALKRGFDKLNINSVVWGLGHENYKENINFDDFELIINLENYSNGWEPNIKDVRGKKFLWSIDAHCRGEQPFLNEFSRNKYDLLLHSTKDYVNEKFKIWFPNAYDDELIYKINMEKKYDIGFCGSLLNRQSFLSKLKSKYNFHHDNFVIGNDMVIAINSYKIHWNRNLSNDINYRNFETIGCGVPLITNFNYQYELLGFEHLKNVVLYNNETEMYELIDLLINNEELRENIGKEGHLLSKKHTYIERCKQILDLYTNF